MRLVPALCWTLEGKSSEPLDPRLLPLLDAIASSASLTAAVAKCGISYRAGWGLLRDYQHKLGTPLARLERGRGAALTPSGHRLIDAQTKAMRRLARILPSLATEVGSQARRAVDTPASLRIAASHDLALAALTRTLPAAAGLALEVAFVGSLNALREFDEGRADVAGFHVPLGGRRDWDRAPFLRALNARRDRLVRFVDREQGLILPRGNPARVKNLSDVALRGLRFVNRQRGSGTRLLIDQIVAAERIDAKHLDGCGSEEFTHPAVAATVASGGADAGFGLRAAAAEYDLAFVPLVRERYFFAVRVKDLETPGIARLVGVLRSAEFARMARRFAGYAIAAAGSVATLDALTATGSARDSS
jgi:putative molybdopterin biosynthesis protein